MPIYDLKCPSCNITKEYLIDSSLSDKMDCEHCSSRLERKPSLFSFKFSNLKNMILKREKKSIVPINLVDVKEDGKFTVTSTSNNPELVDA